MLYIFLWIFLTPTARAFQATNTQPHNGISAAWRNTGIKIQFDDTVDPSTINSNVFIVRGQCHGLYSGTFRFLDPKTLKWSPITPFLYGENIQVTLTTNITTSTGQHLTQSIVFEFRTRSLGCTNFNYSVKSQYSQYVDGRDIELGDLDDDGDLDMFIACSGSIRPENKIFFNNGTGGFSNSGQSIGSGESMEATLGDLDGDGDLDAFVANKGTPCLVWLNNGSGFFSDSGQHIGTNSSQCCDLGDIDGDGDLDAVVGNYRSNGNMVWRNNGNGVFTLAQNLQSFNVSAEAVRFGDLDNDGDLDLIFGNYFGPNYIWINDGTGHFTNNGQALGTGDTYAIELGDLDNDGDLDFYEGNGDIGGSPYEMKDRVWLNDGIGHFTSTGQGIGISNTWDIAFGDVDGDGDLDVFSADKDFSNEIWLNNGSAYFSYSGQTPSTWGVTVALGDFDQDGDLDAVNANFGSWSHRVAYNSSSCLDTTLTDLAISSLDSPDPVTVGTSLTYTFTLSCHGPAEANDTTFFNTLPTNVSFVSAICSQGVWTQNTGTITADLGTIATGASASVSITVIPLAPGTITNFADAYAWRDDGNTNNNICMEITTIQPSGIMTSDLVIIMTDLPDPVKAGNQLTYSILVTNSGPDGATDIIVSNRLPASTSFVSASSSQGNCTETNHIVICELGFLTAHATATITIQTIPSTTGVITNTARVTSNSIDPVPANDEVSRETRVHPPDPVTDLELSGFDTPDPVTPGSITVYSLTVTNHGPDTASNITVVIRLSTNLSFSSGSPTPPVQFTAIDNLVVAYLQPLAAESISTFTLNVQALSAGLGCFTAAATTTDIDPDTDNNEITQYTTIGPSGTMLVVDNTNSNANDGVGNPYLTIQAAINACGPSGRIFVADGLYRENISIADGKQLTLEGCGSENTIIDGQSMETTLFASNSTAVIQGFSIINGQGSSFGGGIQNYFSTLMLSSCRIVSNSAVHGGGMSIIGGTSMVDTVIFDSNIASNQCGGGIYLWTGQAVLKNCTISRNQATVNGGGIDCNTESGYPVMVTLTNCTVAGNTCYLGRGGGLHLDAADISVFLDHCTIVSNTGYIGGGIDSIDGTTTLRGTILALNHSSCSSCSFDNEDYYGTLISQDYNLVQHIHGSIIGTNTHNIYSQDPLLSSLQFENNLTAICKPLLNSPVIDQGNAWGLAHDQRKVIRPVDFPSIVNAGEGTDIGAIERRKPVDDKPMQITKIQWLPDGLLLIEWNGSWNTRYVIEYSTNLFQDILPFKDNLYGNVSTFIGTRKSQDRLFYRITEE